MTNIDPGIRREIGRPETARTSSEEPSLVKQILLSHEQVRMAVERGYSSALEHAIRCGELLILQKETVTATAKWGPWREEHLPNIPQTTASLYMRLAENKEVIQKNQQRVAKEVVKDGNRSLMSIRHAISLLPKKPPTQKQIEAAEKRKAEAAAKKPRGQRLEQKKSKSVRAISSPWKRQTNLSRC
jgi:hypothetical protein